METPGATLTILLSLKHTAERVCPHRDNNPLRTALQGAENKSFVRPGHKNISLAAPWLWRWQEGSRQQSSPEGYNVMA